MRRTTYLWCTVLLALLFAGCVGNQIASPEVGTATLGMQIKLAEAEGFMPITSGVVTLKRGSFIRHEQLQVEGDRAAITLTELEYQVVV